MNLKQIRARLAAIKNEAKTILDQADAAHGLLSAEQQVAFDALMTEREQLEAHADRLAQVEAMQAPAIVAPRAEPVITGGTPAIERDPMRGFKSASHFGFTVKNACRGVGAAHDMLVSSLLDLEAAPTSPHKESGSSDGYMVPPAMALDISKRVMGDEGILGRMNPEPTSSNAVQIALDETTPWGTTGIKAYWTGEVAAATPTKQTLKGATVPLEKLVCLVSASDEILEDAPRLERKLTIDAADAIRYKAEAALVSGDGIGKPLGWNGQLIEVSKKASQTAATVVAENVTAMWSRLIGSPAAPFWLIHPLVRGQLPLMTIGQQPVWNPPGGLKDAPAGNLLGMPVVVSQHCAVLGSVGDIQLIDPSGYAAFVKTNGINFAMSMHLYFDYSVTAFRWTFRLGGQPKYSGNVTAKDGSTTLGSFIATAVRS